MREILANAIDWTSIKLNIVCSIGLISKDIFVRDLIILATLSTLIYNGINIGKEIYKFKNRNK
jgi:hypothetical protein